MKVGIFGGSFNPIHLGHLIVAEYVREEVKLDKVFFVPVGTPCHRENNLLDGNLRLDLIKKAIKNKNYFQVCDIEIKAQGKNYTYDTLLELQKKYPDYEFCEIIGEDSADYLHTWKNYRELLETTEIYIFRRRGYSYESSHKNIKVLNTPIIDISATDIRKRVKEKRSISYLVPESIEKIVQDISWK